MQIENRPLVQPRRRRETVGKKVAIAGEQWGEERDRDMNFEQIPQISRTVAGERKAAYG